MAEASTRFGDYAAGIRAASRGLWSGDLTRDQFFDAMYRIIERGLRYAFLEGMAAAGIREDELEREDWDLFNAYVNSELSYLPGFADFTEQNSRANGGKLATVLARAELWINRYLDMVNAAKLAAATNPKLQWNLGATVEHCKDCLRYAGRVHRARTWKAAGAEPQSPDLECGGWKCLCSLDPTDARCDPGRPPRPTG